ncbi:hypothetical protein CASFOL_031400 [Castilleja foliolosa]|uniref:Protein kinase domain-containing protein n=1 Tax=Castilleja foliolosa TaxID=1961234 RepID=A0ABD3C5A6_9LAMI
MVCNRSVVSFFNSEILLLFALVFAVTFSQGYTIFSDVDAINRLYASLGLPALPGWTESGGDPCGELWQGVVCDAVSSAITEITLNGANLEGELGESLVNFSSITKISMNNNLIRGSIPSELPDSLVSMSLNMNGLTGEIPDAFEALPVLANLDLANNNLSGELPPSIGILPALQTLHLQNNQLSGTLDVLQDLPLQDLDIQNNLFSGPIPPKLLTIPNFRSDGNPFNSSTTPPLPSPTPPGSPPGPVPGTAPSPATSFFPSPTSDQKPPPFGRRPPARQTDDPPSTSRGSNSSEGQRSSARTIWIVWISIASVLSFVIIILAILLFIPRCLRERREREAYGRTLKRHEIAPYTGARENSRESGAPLVLPNHDEQKVAVVRKKEENQERAVSSIPKPQNEEVVKKQETSEAPRMNPYDIDLSRFNIDNMPPPPPPPPGSPPVPPPLEKIIVNPIVAAEASTRSTRGHVPQTSVKAYSIASLQQYTNSFSQDNLVGGGMLGNVYRAELPNGKLFAIKKLEKRVANQLKDEQFIELVNSLDQIRHANVVELIGYCSEHGQKLLVYEYCPCGTLLDALHSDDEFKKKLSWNTRIRMALGAARALEYLHEVCEPPIVHRNFKSANVLLDDELAVLVSDCGLAPLISSGAVSQLSGQLLTTYGYGAPEFESGVYTTKSDVYSFGVVMLEILTGRMSYDRARARGEQFLVRWAIPQFHDIDALSRMVDPALGGKYSPKSLSHFADIIYRCVRVEPEFRPLMSEVVQDLMQLIRRVSPQRSNKTTN